MKEPQKKRNASYRKRESGREKETENEKEISLYLLEMRGEL
jgi:hypothetical protein